MYIPTCTYIQHTAYSMHTQPYTYVQNAHTTIHTHTVPTYMCIHTCTYLPTRTYMHTYVHMYCTYSMHTQPYTHTHTHTRTHTVPTCYLSLSAMGPTALTWELRSRRHRVVMSERNWECASMIWSKSEAAETSFCRMAHPHSNTLQREGKGGGKKEECSRRSRYSQRRMTQQQMRVMFLRTLL